MTASERPTAAHPLIRDTMMPAIPLAGPRVLPVQQRACGIRLGMVSMPTHYLKKCLAQWVHVRPPSVKLLRRGKILGRG